MQIFSDIQNELQIPQIIQIAVFFEDISKTCRYLEKNYRYLQLISDI